MQLSPSESLRIARSFARHRASYDSAATPQKLIAQQLARRLQNCAGPRAFPRAFEFGAGSYHLSRALDRRFDIRDFWLNDLVARPLPSGLRAHTWARPGPVEAAQPPGSLDLLASASTIQWLADPAAVLARLCAQVRRGGWLAISGFGPRQFNEIAEVSGNGAAAPSLMSETALCAALPAGWQVHDHGITLLHQGFASPLEMLRHLRRTGINGLAQKGWTRRDLGDFCARYLREFGRPDGSVPLSWQPIWLIARKL